jgi:hypothetical protein
MQWDFPDLQLVATQITFTLLPGTDFAHGHRYWTYKPPQVLLLLRLGLE